MGTKMCLYSLSRVFYPLAVSVGGKQTLEKYSTFPVEKPNSDTKDPAKTIWMCLFTFLTYMHEYVILDRFAYLAGVETQPEDQGTRIKAGGIMSRNILILTMLLLPPIFCMNRQDQTRTGDWMPNWRVPVFEFLGRANNGLRLKENQVELKTLSRYILSGKRIINSTHSNR